MRALVDPPRTLATTRWQDLAGTRGGSVLLLVPGPAIGDNVNHLAALRVVATALGWSRLGVAFCGGAADVWAQLGRPVELFPLLLPETARRGFDHVVEPARDLPALQALSTRPHAIDRALLDPLGLTAAPPAPPRPLRRLHRVGLFPFSTTPLRMLPLGLVRALVQAVTALGAEVAIQLAPQARLSRVIRDAAASLAPATLRDDTPTVAALLERIGALDYGVFCDSGPLHLARLAGLPGFAVLTTVGADTVLGTAPSLDSWQADYTGPFCRAPCGLAGPIQAPDRAAFGCYDSLRTRTGEAIRVARLPDAANVALATTDPVACVASLDREASAIVAAIMDAIARRRGSPG